MRILIPIFVVLLAFFLRFFKAEDLFVFSGDEEHQLSISQTIVNNFHLEWVGVSSADTEFYLGPFWQYFGAFWLWFSRGDPAILAYVAGTIGVATTILIYLEGKFLFKETIGLVAAFLHASLPLLVYYERKFWNPALISFTALALFYCLAQTKRSSKWWILIAFFYGFVFHVHLSLVPLGIIIIYQLWLQRKKFTKKLVAICFFVFLLVTFPLIGFDIIHKFNNLKTPLRVLAMLKISPSRIDPVGHTGDLFRSLGRIWYLFPHRSNSDEVLHSCYRGTVTTASKNIFPLSVFSFALLVWFFSRKLTWEKENFRLLALFLAVILLSYIFLPNTPLEYYLLGVFPLFLYLPALAFESFKGLTRFGILVLFIIFSLLGIYTVLTATGEYGLVAKQRLIAKVATAIDGKKYELEAQGFCHKFEGWRFLFKTYGKVPDRAFSDKTLGWLYPEEISQGPVDLRVLVSEARAVIAPPPGYQTVVSEGGFKAYIYKLK